MNPEQITERQRSRLALVYVRQSSLHQVIHHQESQRRQRQLCGTGDATGMGAGTGPSRR